MTRKVNIQYECEHPKCNYVHIEQRKTFLGLARVGKYPKGWKRAYGKWLCGACATFEADLEKEKKQQFENGRVIE